LNRGDFRQDPAAICHVGSDALETFKPIRELNFRTISFCEEPTDLAKRTSFVRRASARIEATSYERDISGEKYAFFVARKTIAF